MTHLVASFRRALVAVAPIADAVGIDWRDDETTDDWERVHLRLVGQSLSTGAAGWNDPAFLVSVVLGLATVLLAWIAYSRRYRRKRVEYLVVSSRALLAASAPAGVSVTSPRETVPDPHLVVLRLVNVGDQEVKPAEAHTPFTLDDHGGRIVTASVSATRPDDLEVTLRQENNRVSLEPFLFNAGELVELQVLTSGPPTGVDLHGRVEGLTIARRKSMVYDPGTGPEGQMLPADRFFMFVPAFLLGGLTSTSVAMSEASGPTKVVDRRRLWRV